MLGKKGDEPLRPTDGRALTSSAAGAVGPAAYARWRTTTLGAVTEALEHRLVHDLVGPVRGKRVLDLGCGDGRLTACFAARGASAVGLDADVRMLEAAAAGAARLRVRPQFVHGRVERLPFRDGAFDVVVAVTVFCLLPDSAVAVREAARVLRPGGRLVVGELGRWSLWAALRRTRGWLGHRTWKAAHFSTPAELRGLCERAGVSVEAIRGSVYYPPIGWLARVASAADRWLSAVTTFGAAFLAVAGTKARS